MTAQEQYLGDGVYADHDGYHVVLSVRNGYSATQTIYLEPSVLKALNDYAGKMMSHERTQRDD